MAHRVCDTQPCDRLRETLKTFFSLQTQDKDGPLTISAKRSNGRIQVLHFRYCPFCGTRVSRGAVEFLAAG